MKQALFLIIANKWHLSKQILKYIVSGGSAAVTELALLYVFTDYLGIWYIYSVVLAFTVAFVISFSLQKFWTFQDSRMDGVHKQVTVYLVVSLINLGFNVLAIYILVEKFHVWYMLAQVLIAGVIAISSFLIYKFVIFKKNELPNPTQN